MQNDILEVWISAVIHYLFTIKLNWIILIVLFSYGFDAIVAKDGPPSLFLVGGFAPFQDYTIEEAVIFCSFLLSSYLSEFIFII